jgi:hypothetical protein
MQQQQQQQQQQPSCLLDLCERGPCKLKVHDRMMTDPVIALLAEDMEDETHYVRFLFPDTFKRGIDHLDTSGKRRAALKMLMKHMREVTKLRTYMNKDGSRAGWMDVLQTEMSDTILMEEISITGDGKDGSNMEFNIGSYSTSCAIVHNV